jgi:hypothetical protein
MGFAINTEPACERSGKSAAALHGVEGAPAQQIQMVAQRIELAAGTDESHAGTSLT